MRKSVFFFPIYISLWRIFAITTILLFVFCINLFSQGVSINTTGADADSSAILDVNTTNQRILIPRLTGSGWYMLEYNVPSITGQPVAQTICEGNNTSFSITTPGAGLTYQWQLSTDGGSTWTNQADGGVYSNMTTATMNITNASAGMNSYQYHCVVSGTYTLAAISDAATLTVNPLPNITATPSSQTICSNTVTGITLTSNVSGTTFAWTVVQSGVTGAIAGSGSSIAQTLTNSGTSAGTATYAITPTANTCSGTSTNVVITVNSTPVLSSTLTPTAICSRATFSYTATSATSGAIFAWSRATIAGITEAALSGTGSVSEALTNTTTASIDVTYVYTTTVSGCGNTPQNVVVTVNPTPTVAMSDTTQTICSGIAITQITLSNPNSVPGTTTYSWTRDDTTNITGIAASGSGNITGTLTNATATQQNTIFTGTATSQYGCHSATTTAMVTINPAPAVSSAAMDTICSGAALNYDITSAVSGTTYSWSREAVTGISNEAVSGQTSDPITEILTNTITVAVNNVIYLITPTANGCTGTSTNVVVTVNPTPQGSLAGNAVCPGGTGQFTYTSTSGTNPFTLIISGTTYSGVVSGTPFNASPNPTNTTVYTLTSITDANGCVRTTGITGASATITIIPLPQGSLAGNTVCLGETGRFTYTSASGTSPFTLIISETTYSGVVSGTPFNASPNPTSTTVYTLTSITDATGCVRTTGITGASATITVVPACPTCQTCSSGSCVAITGYAESTGCTTPCYGCYGGSCVPIPTAGSEDTYGSNLCSAAATPHYRCDGAGACTAPTVSVCKGPPTTGNACCRYACRDTFGLIGCGTGCVGCGTPECNPFDYCAEGYHVCCCSEYVY